MNKVKKKPTWYVVTVGARPGIYTNWKEAKQYVDGYSGALYKKYHSQEEAEDAFNRHANALRDPNKEFKWGFTPPPRGNNC